MPEHAVAADSGLLPRSLDGDVAAASVEEFITELLPGLLSQEAGQGLSGTLHRHANDEPMEWRIDLDHGAMSIHEHAKADTAIRGTRSELLLWLTNRCPLETLGVSGRRENLDRRAAPTLSTHISAARGSTRKSIPSRERGSAGTGETAIACPAMGWCLSPGAGQDS
jgi:MDMPI C-terminal domain